MTIYTNTLIPTDRSELSGKAVQHGIALAKRIGVKITVLTVSPPFHTFTTDTQMIEDTPAQYKARMQEYAEKTLGAVARASQAAASHARWSTPNMSVLTRGRFRKRKI
jgi:nucleotide-binding universal stress UspA family protein